MNHHQIQNEGGGEETTRPLKAGRRSALKIVINIISSFSY